MGTSSMPEMPMDTLESFLYDWLFCVGAEGFALQRPRLCTDTESFKIKWFEEVILTQSGNSCFSGPMGSANVLRTFMEFKCLLLCRLP